MKLQSDIRQVAKGQYVDFYYLESGPPPRTLHYQGVVDRVWQGGHSFKLGGVEFHTADTAIAWRDWNDL